MPKILIKVNNRLFYEGNCKDFYRLSKNKDKPNSDINITLDKYPTAIFKGDGNTLILIEDKDA